MNIRIDTDEAMESLGKSLARDSYPGIQIHLSGELGAGKTTLVRGFLRGYGYTGKVKSPTYTLVEPYSFENLSIFHFDLYRILEPQELELIGYREYPGADAICLVEWPEKGGKYIGEPDVLVTILVESDYRNVMFSSFSNQSKSLINNITSLYAE
jgi:tRNA threonylcarbamoyladenosine biosynthesis protein TsaE